MSEFKAQILGILLVVGIFSILATRYNSLVNDSLNRISENLTSVSVTPATNS